MALNKSMLLIRDYENIREILRDIYIFGCFSRDDFIEKGYSGRKYDNEQRRISAYLPEKFIQKRRVNKKVLLYCKYGISDSTRNYLAETYRNKSFTLLDVLAYFYVMQILGNCERMTLPEILNQIPCCNDEIEFTKDNLRVKLDELVENGLLNTEKDGRNINYFLNDDLWSDFSNDELKDIYSYLEFLKNICPLEMPFYFLQRKLKLYLYSSRNIMISDLDGFQFKHNHIFNSLDNDVLLTCLIAIRTHMALQVKKKGHDGDVEFETLPIKVIHDSTYGRQYLLCYNSAAGIATTIRIDKIKAAKCSKNQSDEEKKAINEYIDFDEISWCTSLKVGKQEEIVIRFYFDEITERYILNRIKKEGHEGTITKINNGVYEYRILVSDPNEMVPWIRSFGERAKVISSGEFETENLILEDWKRAVEKYESIS